MSTTLRAAVESTIEKRHAAGTACCPPLDLDRFFAAMMNLLKGQAAMQPEPGRFRRVGSPIVWRTIAGLQDQTVKPARKRHPT